MKWIPPVFYERAASFFFTNRNSNTISSSLCCNKENALDISDRCNIHLHWFRTLAKEAQWTVARKRALFRTCSSNESEVKVICFLTSKLVKMKKKSAFSIKDKYPTEDFIAQYSKIARDIESQPGEIDEDPKYIKEQIDTIDLLKKYISKYLEVKQKRSWASRLFPFSGSPPPTNGKSVCGNA